MAGVEGGFTADDVPLQNGKTVVITGANTGLGFETARVLSARGARVYVACRSEQKACAAIDRIRQINGDVDLVYAALDLGDLSSVSKCASKLQSEENIDVLINNAGIMTPPYELTTDGFESQFGVNHLGHFALTGLLLDKLESAGAGRVVSTSSFAHRSGKVIFDDINAVNGYHPLERYAMSKLCNLLFAYELQRRLESTGHTTISVACHPGVADTELSRYFPSIFKYIAPIIRPLFNTPASGAWPTLRAATGPDAKGADYYGPAKRWETAGPAVPVRSSKASYREDTARRLWKLSIEMTGVDPGL
jgi:NAD(P)-dependent dehydrogenase (short-subunit alcohol dehydrogenase family)